jgi:hypothetical protein
MSPVPDWDSPSEVKKHTEHALLFSEERKIFETDFGDMMEEVRSGGPDDGRRDYSDVLKIRAVPTGLDRLERSDVKLYENSIWIVDYDLLFGDVNIEASIDELRSKLQDSLCPDIVEVRVFVNDPPRNPKQSPAQEVKKEYGIYKRYTCSSYDQLVGSLCTYFGSIDPDRGQAAKVRNFKWAKTVRDLVL